MNTREKDDRLSVHKDTKRGTWYVKIKYTDWTGEKRRPHAEDSQRKKMPFFLNMIFICKKRCTFYVLQSFI